MWTFKEKTPLPLSDSGKWGDTYSITYIKDESNLNFSLLFLSNIFH